MKRILTTHAGSLIRAPELEPFLAAEGRAEVYDDEAFAGSLRRAVGEVVHRQASAGIDIVNDGELGKTSWILYQYGRVSGIESRIVPLKDTNVLPPTRDKEAFAEFYAGHDVALDSEYFNQADGSQPAAGEAKDQDGKNEGMIWVCTGPIAYDRSALQRDIANLNAALEDVVVADAFLTAVAPASQEHYLQNEYYSNDEELLFAVADALHEEYKGIVDAGYLLQVDDPVLMLKYETILMLGGSVEDYCKWAELRVEALNHALTGIPEERIRYHMCCGSILTPHTFDTPLRAVVDLMLKVHARAYSFEQANVRHEHEWQVWEEVKLPEEKVLIPGFVTHKTPLVEHPELVAHRITRMANLVGPERVIAGTDCGFSQGALAPRVPLYTQWAKLEALAEGARLATKQLSGSRTIA